MTDKKIIIDGVNVRECKFRCYIDRCMAHSCTTKYCKEYSNCYYKQLQRKEQKYNSTLQENVVLLQQYNEKEQECEELKEQLDTAKINYRNECDFRDLYRQQRDRYKQALEKIEEILTYYAISTLGDLQPDGTYKYIFGKSLINGGQCIHYDPRKAQEGLKIINEVQEGG